MKNNFIGMDGFVWFLGVVEDRQDPYLIGRVRVRCFGHHTGDKVILPTEDLPWSQVMLPVTSAGISGVGQSPIGLVEGSHVFGFFRDGEARQEPVVMGSLPGYPTELGDTTKGFYSPIKGSDDPHAPDYLTNESSHPRWKNSPDNSQLATRDDYSFNPSLTEHASIAVDKEVRESVGIVGVAITDPFTTAAAFINKGGSSLFGFVTDMITSTLTPLIGNQLLSSLGGTLGGLSIMQNGFVGTITDFGKNAWQTITGLADDPFNALLETSLVKQTLAPDGFLSAEIFVKSANLTADVLDNMVKNGFQQVTNVDPSNPLAQGYEVFNVTNYALASQLLGADRITKNVDAFNLANEVVAKGEAITKDTLSSAQKFVNDAETTLTNQAQALQDAENQLKQSSEVLVVRDAQGNVIELVEEEFQDSQSQQGRAEGGKGIPVASTSTPAGRTKLMNQFISKQGGVSMGWSVPTPPEVSDVYPYRHVYESESGHYMIYDDTPGNEMIQQRHRSGTQYFIANDGTKTDITVSDEIKAVTGSSYNTITERQVINIGDGLKVKVNASGKYNDGQNHYEILVGAGANVNIQVEKGDINLSTVDGNINMNSGGKINMTAKDDINIISEQDVTVNAGDDITLKAGDKIRLN